MSSSATDSDLLILEGVPGKANFKVGQETFKTWYIVCGDLKSEITPLVAVNGGPGCSYHYISNFTDVYRTHQIPVILYDPLGVNNSLNEEYHLHERDGSFFTLKLYMDELENLVSYLGISSRYDLIGHSYGGMLIAHLAAQRQPKGLRKLILSNAPSSMPLFVEGTRKLIDKLPPDVRDTLRKHEADGTTDSPEFIAAMHVFVAEHCCRITPQPEPLRITLKKLLENRHVYELMNGPTEFIVTGTLKDCSVVDEIHKVNVSTLLINGEYDEVQDLCVSPYFEKIPKVKWVKLMDASNSSNWEQRERYMKIVGDFLRQAE